MLGKIWVHVRFIIKFIPLQLLGVGLNIYGLIFMVLPLWLLFGYSNFLLVWALISICFLPIAIILDNWGKWNPLWFMMDDSRFIPDDFGGGTFILAEDYRTWLDGRLINFKTLWLWHNRNRIWNFLSLFNKPSGDEYLVQLIKNDLTFRDQTIELSDDYGFMRHDNFAGLKWITKSGDEGWQTHSGVKISYDYSIFGTMALYYRIGETLYYKYSRCVVLFKVWKWIPFGIGGKDIWLTIKYHANNELGTIHFKLQWEKEY